MPEPRAPQSQTLSRGIRVLEVLAEAVGPMRIDQIARVMGLHRSIVYRIVRTLEDHRLVTREEHGACRPGPGLAVLAAGVARSLVEVALPELAALTEELAMTSFLVIRDQEDCVTVSSVEPRHAKATLAQRPGTRHSLTYGAPGIALLTLAADDEVPAAVVSRVRRAREVGYAVSHGEVIAGLSSVAVPVRCGASTPAALAVVYLGSENDVDDIARHLTAKADAIAAQVGC